MQDPTPVTTAGGVAVELVGALLVALGAAVLTAVRAWLAKRAQQAWARVLVGAIDNAKVAAKMDQPELAAGVRAVTTAIGRAMDWAPEPVKRTHEGALKAAGANGDAILGPILAAARKDVG